MLVNLHGYAEGDSFRGHVHTDQVRFVPGKINYSFSSNQDTAHMSLFFRDAKAARDFARRINEVADSIEQSSVAPAVAAE
jgi:hypothetical protein